MEAGKLVNTSQIMLKCSDTHELVIQVVSHGIHSKVMIKLFHVFHVTSSLTREHGMLDTGGDGIFPFNK